MKTLFRTKKYDEAHSCHNSSQKSVQKTPAKGTRTNHGFTASTNPPQTIPTRIIEMNAQETELFQQQATKNVKQSWKFEKKAQECEKEAAEAGRKAAQYGAKEEAALARKAVAERSIQERLQRVTKMQEETRATHAKIDAELADLLKDLDLDQTETSLNPTQAETNTNASSAARLRESPKRKG